MQDSAQTNVHQERAYTKNLDFQLIFMAFTRTPRLPPGTGTTQHLAFHLIFMAFHLERALTIWTVRAISPFQVEAFQSYPERSSFNRLLQ